MLLVGDVREKLRELPDESVHCVVTSPPYWGLRDYGSDSQIGLEPTIDEYIANMTAVFHEVHRVLRKDGTAWVNMGDGYANSPAGHGGWDGNNKIPDGSPREARQKDAKRPLRIVGGLKPKDLIGQPWRLAFALQADGWYLRSDIIWAKPNPMPESVTDRPTKAHEYVFLLTKQGRYYYDADAVRERHATADQGREGRSSPPNKGNLDGFNERAATFTRYGWIPNSGYHPSGRNARSVWNIPAQKYPDAHFATYPEALVRPCILAGCPLEVCAECGAPWVREVETPSYGDWNDRKAAGEALTKGQTKPSGAPDDYERKVGDPHPSCDCGAGTSAGVVLDPFFGSGTTGKVAHDEGREFVGIELNPEYAALAERRIEALQHQLAL